MADNKLEKEESWHYSENTLKLLSLSVAQIKGILNDGGQSVSDLTESFIEMAQTLKKLMNHETDVQHTDLNKISHQIEQGIVAFQFYDRISQRLDHVSNSLQQMGEIIGDSERRLSIDEWTMLQKAIQTKYTMESERALFEEIMKGTPVEEALKNYKDNLGPAKENDIELF